MTLRSMSRLATQLKVLLEPDPERVNDAIVAHATGGKVGEHGQKKPGLVKRAWRAGFAKRRPLKKQKREERERERKGEKLLSCRIVCESPWGSRPPSVLGFPLGEPRAPAVAPIRGPRAWA